MKSIALSKRRLSSNGYHRHQAVCQIWLLSVIFCRFYLASDSEPVLYIDVRLHQTHNYIAGLLSLARMKSPLTTGLPRITRGIISICTLQSGDLFLASGSEPTINVSGEAGHKIDCWLAIARQEKIVNLKGLSGYNPPRYTRETCSWPRKA